MIIEIKHLDLKWTSVGKWSAPLQAPLGWSDGYKFPNGDIFTGPQQVLRLALVSMHGAWCAGPNRWLPSLAALMKVHAK